MREASVSGQFDPRITAYFGDAVLQAGFMPLPHLFLRHYRKLGLSQVQAMFVLQLMEIAWDVGDPPTTVSKLAERMGVGHRTIQVCSREVHDLGLVEIYDQFDASGAQVENGYDLSPLFRRLAALAPAPTPQGELRMRRRRPGNTTTDDDTAEATSAPAASYAGPVQKSASPPPRNSAWSTREVLQGRAESVCTGTVQDDSGLKLETKNQTRKQTKTEKKQSRGVGGVSVATRPASDTSAEAGASGYSLRWKAPLDRDDIARSEHVLDRIGLNARVVQAVAPTLHPAECWALWCYARGAGLGTAWIASQCYDFEARRPREAGLARRFDDAGRALAMLADDDVELVLSTVDSCCPGVPDRLRAHPRLGQAEPPIHAAIDAVWAVMSEQRRGGAAAPLALVGAPTKVPAPLDPRWQAALRRMAQVIAPSEWDTWIEPLDLLALDGGSAVVGAPNCFARDQLAATYGTLLEDVLTAELGHPVAIEVVIAPAATGRRPA